MDYVGHAGRPDLRDRAAAASFFRRIDAELYRAAWFAQSPGDPLFSGLIDYAAWRGRRVLEVGCGLGAVAGELARQGVHITALDLTSTGVTAAKKRFCLDGSRGAAVQGDAENLPFDDGSFDAVWSWGALHHTTTPSRAIAEIHRVLRPGGELRMMVYNRHSFYNWIAIVLRRGILGGALRRHSMQELWNRYSDGRDIGGCPFVRYYSARELRGALPGFEVLEMCAFEQKTTLAKFVPRSLRASAAAHIPDAVMRALFRKLGMLLFCRARKPG